MSQMQGEEKWANSNGDLTYLHKLTDEEVLHHGILLKGMIPDRLKFELERRGLLEQIDKKP